VSSLWDYSGQKYISAFQSDLSVSVEQDDSYEFIKPEYGQICAETGDAGRFLLINVLTH